MVTEAEAWDERFDVVVVGGGGAGMAAALSATQTAAEASVLLVQKEPRLGGVTGIAMGSFTAAGTSQQREAGIHDSAEAHLEDLDKFVEEAAAGPSRSVAYDHGGDLRDRDDSRLRRLLVEHGAETLAWLGELGCEYLGPFGDGHHRVPRLHVIANGYVDVLGPAMEDASVTVWRSAPVDDLVLDGSGAVAGVVVRRDGSDRRVAASAGVVLATGSYVNNHRLRERYTSNSSAPAIHEANTGDGHEMAARAGAALVNMDSQSLMLRCGPPLYTGPDFASLVDAGAVLVDDDGERFIDEVSAYDQVFSSVLRLPGRQLFVLFDQAVAEAFRSWPDHLSTFSGQPWGYIDDYLETDSLVREERLGDLARHLPGDGSSLEATVQRYNEGVAYPGPGRRDPLGRTRYRRSLVETPWYLLGPMRPYAAVTNGGIAIDTRFHARTEDGEVIEGLYAAGSAAGGVHLYGHGHHHSWVFTSGRLAGRSVGETRG